jgi:hypothetical protein
MYDAESPCLQRWSNLSVFFSPKITKLNEGKHFCPLDKKFFTTSETLKSIESKGGPCFGCHPIPSSFQPQEKSVTFEPKKLSNIDKSRCPPVSTTPGANLPLV